MGWEIGNSISGRSKRTKNSSPVVEHSHNFLGNDQLRPLVREQSARDLKLTNHLLVLRLITNGTIRLAVMWRLFG